ncbi:carboxypeptidase-like regulatory domain-containing protein [Mucilaginibacter corticis]|uniref:carboxypeptidase-like regulatory domain-containing protein n=1 Tax=Mucilaginibacter corticis TaxID=2597670 RepID=UPI001642A873|nr:carboxypeptidase-like regulatory domain-containing protein [Mucilaginibacter corticis]
MFIPVVVFAQSGYDVSGVVTGEKGEPVKSATVFIGGSERVTHTGEDGRFIFSNVPQGTFQLSVQVLGYSPLTRNIIVKAAPLNVDLQLSVKSIVLQGVQIGKKSAWAINFKIFKENFLGESANARQCVIVNPKVINFSTKKGLLLADADDFLIIENKRLGYRLRYQLEDFGYNSVEDIALYHGECTFEDLDGTDEQKKEWAKNRLDTYKGSFTHFLRSVYSNKVLENGFIARPLYGYGSERVNPDIEDRDKLVINDTQVKFDSLVASIDTSFKSFKFKQLYVLYDPQKARAFFSNASNKTKTVIIDNKATVLKLASDAAVIDRKGSYTDYRDFFIYGNWAKARLADQLPVEYQPPFIPLGQKDYPTDKLVAKLQKWRDSIPQEKLYLQLDKPCYAHSDTIWFKGYLTIGSRHERSALSGAVYVDLIDQQNEVINELKLPVVSGMMTGNFVLDDTLKDGRYRIRAFTRWMRNAGEDYFFDQAINVGNPDKTGMQKDKNSDLQKTDIQFFPEGGSLVNGLSSRVSFKSVGVSGLGQVISGKVTDNDHKEVADIVTLHAGMGSFLLKPLSGKTYTANINFADGSTKSIALPTALNDGYVLNVYQPNRDSILVRVRASATLQASTIYLVVHSSGEIISALPIVFSGAVSSIWLDKRAFPSGIAQFTIFNANNEPLNERKAFIKTDDHMKLTVKATKPAYKSREHVQLNLDANDSDDKPTFGNFSVTVTDESKVLVDENSESTIFSNILLKSDLKGYIEKPNYYFTADTDTVNIALDNLMLTQGYRRFEWKLLDNMNFKPAFAAEGLGSTVSGLVTTLSHQPLAKANVLIASVKAGFKRDTVTDANGRFKFDKMFIGDSLKFAVQALDTKGSDKVIITLDSIAQIKLDGNNGKINKIITASSVYPKNDDEDRQTIVGLKGNTVLKQVNIKTQEIKKASKIIAPQSTFQVPEQGADQTITIANPESYIDLTRALEANLPGIRVDIDENGYNELVSTRPSNSLLNASNNANKNVGKEIGLIVNGRKITSKGELDEILQGSILPEDIAKIEIVRTNVAVMNYLHSPDEPGGGYAGYVLLFTKLGSSKRQYNPNMANITPRGFNKVRTFYSPHYDHPEVSNNQPDQRTTIYWKPYLNTDATGKATFDFYNADSPGKYRVVVEGISANGELGRQVYTYKVE